MRRTSSIPPAPIARRAQLARVAPRMRLARIACFGLIAALTACEDEPAAIPPGSSAADLESAEDLAGELETERAALPNTCELIPPERVRQALGLAEEIEVTAVPPLLVEGSCRYDWPNPDYDPQEYIRRAMANARRGMTRGEAEETLIGELTAPTATPNFNVHVEIKRAHESEAAAEQRFASMVRMLEEGITVDPSEVDGLEDEVVFQHPGRAVEIADEGYWSPSLRQLIARDGTRVSVVTATVSTEDEEANLDAAKRVMRLRFEFE